MPKYSALSLQCQGKAALQYHVTQAGLSAGTGWDAAKVASPRNGLYAVLHINMSNVDSTEGR